MKIDHIGYAVKKIERARQVLIHMGYSFDEIISDKDRNINIAFGEMNGYRIELVSPMSKGSPVDEILSKVGATPYHFCYRSEDLDKDIEDLKNNKFKISIPPAPAIAFGGKRVVFLYSLVLGLVEIVEE